MKQEISYLTFNVKDVSFKMMKVEGGSFEMKRYDHRIFPENEEYDLDVVNFELIKHKTLSNYYIGETPVTQDLWIAVMGENPSWFEGAKRPVENITWDDYKAFITKLNSLTGMEFRLPTEFEWEFAARGGNNSHNYKYSGSNNIKEVAWYIVNSGRKSHDVALKKPNELGIYDMSGNVGELCYDEYDTVYPFEFYEALLLGTKPSIKDKRIVQWRVAMGGDSASDRGCCAIGGGGQQSLIEKNWLIGFRLALSE